MTHANSYSLLHLLANEKDATALELETKAYEMCAEATKLRLQADELREIAEEHAP